MAKVNKVIEEIKEEVKNKNINKIKINQYMTGSYGVFSRDMVLNIPEDIDFVIAASFVNSGAASII